MYIIHILLLVLTYTYRRKFRSLNSVMQNSVIRKIWQRKNSIITITTIITSPPHHLTTSPPYHITTSPHHHITITTSPHHHHHHHHLTTSPSPPHHITTSPHPHITSSPHHHFTNSFVQVTLVRMEPNVFSHKARSGDDVGHLVCATGAALARLPSDASYTLKLHSGLHFALEWLHPWSWLPGWPTQFYFVKVALVRMGFAPQQRVLFRHQLPKFVRTCDVFTIFTSESASRHSRAHLFDISTSKRAPNMVCPVRYVLTAKSASRHTGVISHLPRCLRTRHFNEPTFQPSGATKHWENIVFRAPRYSFFLLTLSLLWSSFFSLFLFSDASTLCCFICPKMSEVWLLNFLRSCPVDIPPCCPTPTWSRAAPWSSNRVSELLPGDPRFPRVRYPHLKWIELTSDYLWKYIKVMVFLLISRICLCFFLAKLGSISSKCPSDPAGAPVATTSCWQPQCQEAMARRDVAEPTPWQSTGVLDLHSLIIAGGFTPPQNSSDMYIL